MRTNYRRGVDVERKVMAQLADEGWPTVLRTAGSHGIADVVAFGPRGLLAVQVKREAVGKPLVYRRERLGLGALALPPGGVAELWAWAPHRGFRRLCALEAPTRAVRRCSRGLHPCAAPQPPQPDDCCIETPCATHGCDVRTCRCGAS